MILAIAAKPVTTTSRRHHFIRGLRYSDMSILCFQLYRRISTTRRFDFIYKNMLNIGRIIKIKVTAPKVSSILLRRSHRLFICSDKLARDPVPAMIPMYIRQPCSCNITLKNQIFEQTENLFRELIRTFRNQDLFI